MAWCSRGYQDMAWESHQDQFRERTYFFPSSPTSPAPILSKTGSQEHNSPPLPSPSWPLNRQGRDRGRTYGGWPAHPQNMFYPSPPEAHLLYSFPKTSSTAFGQASLYLPKEANKVDNNVPRRPPEGAIWIVLGPFWGENLKKLDAGKMENRKI